MPDLAVKPPDLDAQGQPVQPPDLDANGQPVGGGMNFAIVNGERVPVDDSPLDLVAGAAHNLNPIPAIQAAGKALTPEVVARAAGAPDAASYGPLNAAKGILQAQTHVKYQADAAWQQGDTATALRKYVDWLLPVIGPVIDQAADKMAHGQPWRGAGEAIGLGLGLGGSKALETARIKVPAVAAARNPVEAAAVEFGRQQGVPIDAATATGNPFIRGVQKGTAYTPLGSLPAMAMQGAQADALEHVGRGLSQQTLGVAATPETAGARVAEGLQGKIAAHAQYAEHAYGTLEQIAKDPKNTVNVQTGSKTVNTGVLDAKGNPITRTVPVTEPIAIPVDLRRVRAMLKPIYTSIARSMPVTQRQASAGFQALENIVNGRDYEPLLQSERDLGALKEIARGADLPELRSISQGLAAQGVTSLQSAIDAAAAKAGPKAIQALKDGRAATKAKWETADVLDPIKAEPVQAFRQAIAPQDAGIALLRQIQQQTPQVIPNLARAWMDQQLGTATSEGGFERAQRLQAEWQKLGPETKKILFPQQGQIPALENYFRLAKLIAQNPNPSGSALVGIAATSLAALQEVFQMPIATAVGVGGSWGISKLLNSPKAVQLFTKGTTLMLGPGKASKAAMSMGVANVLQAAREAGLSPTAAGAAPVATSPANSPRQSAPQSR